MRIVVSCCRRYIAESVRLLLRRELRKERPTVRICVDPRTLRAERSDLLIIDYLLLAAMPPELLDKLAGKTLLLGTNCAALMERRRLAVLLSMGLLGIVPSTADAATFRKCVLTAASGRLLFSSDQIRSILNESGGPAADEPPAAATLTAKEFEIVRLLCRGCRNKEIMARLGISEQAVKSHVSRVGRKLGVTDRLQIVLHALRHWPHLREEAAPATSAVPAAAAAGATFVAQLP